MRRRLQREDSGKRNSFAHASPYERVLYADFKESFQFDEPRQPAMTLLDFLIHRNPKQPANDSDIVLPACLVVRSSHLLFTTVQKKTRDAGIMGNTGSKNKISAQDK